MSLTITRPLRRATLPFLAPLVAACGTEISGLPQVDLEVIEEVQFAESLGIDLADMEKLPSGVYIKDLSLGTGEQVVQEGDILDLDFAGWLKDGTLFDQGSFTFLVGDGAVIRGFSIGVVGMRAGGKRRMIIPPALGFGANGVGPIPPGAVLVFEVTIRQVR